MTTEGDGTYQSVDQRTIDAMRATPGITGMMGTVLNVATRAADNAALAAAQEAGGSMIVDPDQVDKLAQFFDDEARAMRERRADIADLATVEAPGLDPVSTQTAEKYGQVASGGSQAYLDNYLKLADYFEATAEKLRKSARQTRTDQQNAADSFGGGNLA
ncbi:hypothetical protein GCM10011581_49110 [Saccharopolyspora subtropica]|uniref:PE domain-containing protein n=1 Tax=Saccharopolyspora thermophila TaxID=89367 RepID=A0A917NK19_9PSEU|nr:PE domain-containing protein [Saccharopolyspora subtropica]GGJ06336.1 hypothetical protein GCM10011581_49110 [Saccharopolyspora subtropica]